MKKIKNSVKTETKNMVQKELSKIMAKQLSNQDFFKEIMQDVINDFYEEDVNLDKPKLEQKINPTYDKIKSSIIDRTSLINDIMNGQLKEEFSTLVGDEKNFNQHQSFNKLAGLDIPESKVELNDKLLQLLFGQPNICNLSSLKKINAKQAVEQYDCIEYTKEFLDKLFNYIEENKSQLIATHEQIHVGDNSVEIYKINNKEEKDDKHFFLPLINQNHFSFELRIKTNEISKKNEMFLENVIFEGRVIEHGFILIEDFQKLLNLSKEIYSETIKEPVPKTENQILKTHKLKKISVEKKQTKKGKISERK